MGGGLHSKSGECDPLGFASFSLFSPFACHFQSHCPLAVKQSFPLALALLLLLSIEHVFPFALAIPLLLRRSLQIPSRSRRATRARYFLPVAHSYLYLHPWFRCERAATGALPFAIGGGCKRAATRALLFTVDFSVSMRAAWEGAAT